ncbi:MAG: DUF2975 domain-containing protein [Proteobacteria bacterium]|nr:DUF2975 domain-containing protein [Pseudomonadota bacterium]
MRAMGPGSVSSLLKTALDVVYVILWVMVAAALLLAIVVLFLQNDRQATLQDGDFMVRVNVTGPRASILLVCGAIYLSIIQFVIGRLRRLFTTLTAGDPFHPDNVARLRMIGIGLAVLELATVAQQVGTPLLLTEGAAHLRMPGLDITAWFAVIVVFVLAEVFREGARLRREAELTI